MLPLTCSAELRGLQRYVHKAAVFYESFYDHIKHTYTALRVTYAFITGSAAQLRETLLRLQLLTTRKVDASVTRAALSPHVLPPAKLVVLPVTF